MIFEGQDFRRKSLGKRSGNGKEKVYQVRWESLVGFGKEAFVFIREWGLLKVIVRGKVEKVSGGLILEEFEFYIQQFGFYFMIIKVL